MQKPRSGGAWRRMTPRALWFEAQRHWGSGRIQDRRGLGLGWYLEPREGIWSLSGFEGDAGRGLGQAQLGPGFTQDLAQDL